MNIELSREEILAIVTAGYGDNIKYFDLNSCSILIRKYNTSNTYTVSDDVYKLLTITTADDFIQISMLCGHKFNHLAAITTFINLKSNNKE
ncbi:hypothetical protein DSECCO2_120370 [anaerobic digester metagenome]